MTGLKDQFFGVEVEMTGITREQAAKALGDYFHTSPVHLGGAYDAWAVKDSEGKTWKLMSDASIRGERKVRGGYLPEDNRRYKVELVTPKLTYAELPKFQECIRQVRHAGAKVNDSCGLHVHVDAANHNRQSLKNLISIMYSKEDLLFKALQVNEARASRWCQKVREPMLREARKLSADPTKDLTRLESIWYEGSDGSREHCTQREPNTCRLWAALSGAFCRSLIGGRQPTCFANAKNPSKMPRPQVLRSQGRIHFRPDKKKAAGNIGHIAKAFSAVWAEMNLP